MWSREKLLKFHSWFNNLAKETYKFFYEMTEKGFVLDTRAYNTVIDGFRTPHCQKQFKNLVRGFYSPLHHGTFFGSVATPSVSSKTLSTNANSTRSFFCFRKKYLVYRVPATGWLLCHRDCYEKTYQHAPGGESRRI